MKRAVGFCTTEGTEEQKQCEDFSKGIFVLNSDDLGFFCPRCRREGLLVREKGIAQRSNLPFKEVRVEFDFDPVVMRFKHIAIVRDEAVRGPGGKYTLLSPLVKTEKRALRVGEAILANLQRNDECEEIPKTTEMILSFDEPFPVFSRKLQRLSREWENSRLGACFGQEG